MMTKTILLAIGILLLASSISAQDAMPTKEETVNYLNKRLQEVEGRTGKVSSDGHPRNLSNLSFSMKNDVAVYLYSSGGGLSGLLTMTFNPAHIESVQVNKLVEGETVGWLFVSFKGKLVKRTCTFKCDESKDLFSFPYLAANPESGEKVKKAFLHLRDLAKAEDDLF